MYIIIQLLAVINHTPPNTLHGPRQPNGEHQSHDGGHAHLTDEVETGNEGGILLPSQVYGADQEKITLRSSF